MTQSKAFLAVVGLVGILFGLTAEAVADGGAPPGVLADCETTQPKGASLNGTVGLQVYAADFSADVTFRFQFNGQSHILRAHLGGVNTATIMDAVCSILAAPVTGASLDGTQVYPGPPSAPTVQDIILGAIGRPNSTLQATKRGISGLICPSDTLPCSQLDASNRPAGLNFDIIPPGASVRSAVADVTFYLDH